LVLPLRPVEEPAVLRRLAQAREERRGREALLVRRGRQAPRSARYVQRDPSLLKAATQLIGGEIVAEGTMAFHFERPAGFRHESGQNALFTLAGESRTFSIASAPYEAHLTVATRMRDSVFKRTLKTAQPGLKIEIDGPDGIMTLHEDAARPAVFLAGGIGITPF